MKKAEFIGYLYALKDLAVDDTFDDFDDGVEWVLDKIIERAQQLEETTSVPYYPTYPVNPPWYQPTITWDTTAKPSIPEPNSWSIDTKSAIPENWKVIK